MALPGGFWRLRPAALVAGAILGISALSLLLPSVPTTDPWGWIVWGREVARLQLDTAIGGSPVWKPLPVLFTTPYSLFGAAAPALWMLTARAAGGAALVLAYRLAARLGGRAAGAVAVVALLFSGDFIRALAHGYTEPMMAALVLGAADRHLAGRRGQALGLLFLASLGRPEAWVFLVAYLVLACRADRVLRLRGAALAAAAPALWLGGDWWGSGDPFHAEKVASLISRGSHAGIQAWTLEPVLGLPLLVLAVVACVATWRRGERTAGLFGAAALGWTVLVLAGTLSGSAASNRFLAPAVALGCVLAGAGAAELVRSLPSPRLRPALAVALVAVAIPLMVVRAGGVDRQLDNAVAQAGAQDRLREAVADHVDGRPCGQLVLPGNLGWNEGALAWQLGVGLDRIGVLPLRHVNPGRLARALHLSRRRRAPVYSMPSGLGSSVTLVAPAARPVSVGEQPLRVRTLGADDGWGAYRVAGAVGRRCAGS